MISRRSRPDRAPSLELAALAALVLALAGGGCSKRTVAPSRDLNVPPVANLQVSGTCSLGATHLDASGSNDPDGTIRLYEWDLDNNGTIDSSGTTLITIDRAYPPGAHRVKLVVTDDAGAYAVTVANFDVESAETTYVSSATGSPAGPGTRATPFSTVGAALALGGGGTCAHVVLVALGYYPEAIVLPSNTILRGGFDASTWSHTPGSQTEIWVGANPATATAISNTEVSDIRFVTADEIIPGTTAIAFAIDHCGPTLVFRNCTFDARAGAPGTDGIDGIHGGPGGPGQDGSGSTGGAGGVSSHFLGYLVGGNGGSTDDSNTPHAGDRGGASACAVGGSGGAFGAGCAPPASGMNGGPGANGPDGLDASGPATPGDFNGAVWVPGRGSNGGQGCDGAGGGGGGSGAACPIAGGGGGGGGGGSPGATGGFGGIGGGGSIGLVLYGASPVFASCSWKTLDGGTGGKGGDGGASRMGGSGGSGGLSGVTTGGHGGIGGSGGAGGGGQGGPGGPSWCIALVGGSSPTITSPTYLHGSGGAGGAGGRLGGSGVQAAAGPSGPSGNIGP